MNDFAPVIFLSIQVAITAVILDAPFAIFFGWWLARKNFPGKCFVNTILAAPLVIPPVVTGYFLLVVLGRRGVIGAWLESSFGISLAFTWKAAAIASAVIALPLFVRAVQVAIAGVDMKLEEAGRVLRQNEWQVFRRITLPLAWHGFVAGALLAFARALGEFGATIIFAGNIPGATQTIPLAIFSLINQPGGEQRLWPFLLASVALAFAAVLVSEWMARQKQNM
jgi:molybdate transport system permease protein